MTEVSSIYDSLWTVFLDVRDLVAKDVSYDISTIANAETLLQIRFGDLVWLCRTLELVYEASHDARPAVYEYDNVHASRNVARLEELIAACDLPAPISSNLFESFLENPIDKEAAGYFRRLLEDAAVLLRGGVSFNCRRTTAAPASSSLGLPPTVPTPGRNRFARTAVMQSPKSSALSLRLGNGCSGTTTTTTSSSSTTATGQDSFSSLATNAAIAMPSTPKGIAAGTSSAQNTPGGRASAYKPSSSLHYYDNQVPVPSTTTTTSSTTKSTAKNHHHQSATGFVDPPTPHRTTLGGSSSSTPSATSSSSSSSSIPYSSSNSFIGNAFSSVMDKVVTLTVGVTPAGVEALKEHNVILSQDVHNLLARDQEARVREMSLRSSIAQVEGELAAAKTREATLAAVKAKQDTELAVLRASMESTRAGATSATRLAVGELDEMRNKLNGELARTTAEASTLRTRVGELEGALAEARRSFTIATNEHAAQVASMATNAQSIRDTLLNETSTKHKTQNHAETLKKELASLRADHKIRMAKEEEYQTLFEKEAAQSKLLAQQVQELSTQVNSLLAELSSTRTQLEASIQERNDAVHAVKQAMSDASAASSSAKLLQSHAGLAMVAVRSLRSEMRSFGQDISGTCNAYMQDFSAQTKQLMSRIQSGEEAVVAANSRYMREQSERRRLHNKLSELRGNIRVYARVRPLLQKEIDTQELDIVKTLGPQELIVNEVAPEGGAGGGMNGGNLNTKSRTLESKTFEFDRVFGPESTQASVFEEVAPMVTSALDGYHACIFTYGQTGSGKTHTMEGVPSDRGVYYRALEELFEQIASRCESKEWKFSLKVSMVEIYNEFIVDLLVDTSSNSKGGNNNNNHGDMDESTSTTATTTFGRGGGGSSSSSSSSSSSMMTTAPAASLEIKKGPLGNYLPEATVVEVSTQTAVEALVRRAAHNRTVGKTNANEHSSRSHSLLMIEIHGHNSATEAVSVGKLVLVDLAGSERVSKTGAEGVRLEEAKNINLSLSSLGDVIHALSKKASHIPFRNSKLTYLLADSLGKDNKTLMIVQVSPSAADRGETLCSLNFAARVKTVELGKALKHADTGELTRVKTDLKKSQDVATKLQADVEKMSERIASAEARETNAKQRIQALEAENVAARAAAANAAASAAAATTAAAGKMSTTSSATAPATAEFESLKGELAAASAQLASYKEEVDAAKILAREAQKAKQIAEKDAAAARKQVETEVNNAKLQTKNAQAEGIKKAVAEAIKEREARAAAEAEALKRQVKELQANLERASAQAKKEVGAAVSAARIAWEHERVKIARASRQSTAPAAAAAAAPSTTTTASSALSVVAANAKPSTNSRKQNSATSGGLQTSLSATGASMSTFFSSSTASLSSSLGDADIEGDASEEEEVGHQEEEEEVGEEDEITPTNGTIGEEQFEAEFVPTASALLTTENDEPLLAENTASPSENDSNGGKEISNNNMTMNITPSAPSAPSSSSTETLVGLSSTNKRFGSTAKSQLLNSAPSSAYAWNKQQSRSRSGSGMKSGMNTSEVNESITSVRSSRSANVSSSSSSFTPGGVTDTTFSGFNENVIEACSHTPLILPSLSSSSFSAADTSDIFRSSRVKEYNTPSISSLNNSSIIASTSTAKSSVKASASTVAATPMTSFFARESDSLTYPEALVDDGESTSDKMPAASTSSTASPNLLLFDTMAVQAANSTQTPLGASNCNISTISATPVASLSSSVLKSNTKRATTPRGASSISAKMGENSNGKNSRCITPVAVAELSTSTHSLSSSSTSSRAGAARRARGATPYKATLTAPVGISLSESSITDDHVEQEEGGEGETESARLEEDNNEITGHEVEEEEGGSSHLLLNESATIISSDVATGNDDQELQQEPLPNTLSQSHIAPIPYAAVEDNAPFTFGSRERARLAGMPSPKPIGILKRKQKQQQQQGAGGENSKKQVENADGTDAAVIMVDGGCAGGDGTKAKKKNARVALFSPESATVHLPNEDDATTANAASEVEKETTSGAAFTTAPSTSALSKKSKIVNSPAANVTAYIAATTSRTLLTTSSTSNSSARASSSSSSSSSRSSSRGTSNTRANVTTTTTTTTSGNSMNENSGSSSSTSSSNAILSVAALSSSSSSALPSSSENNAAAAAAVGSKRVAATALGTSASSTTNASTTVEASKKPRTVSTGPARVRIEPEKKATGPVRGGAARVAIGAGASGPRR